MQRCFFFQEVKFSEDEKHYYYDPPIENSTNLLDEDLESTPTKTDLKQKSISVIEPQPITKQLELYTKVCIGVIVICIKVAF